MHQMAPDGTRQSGPTKLFRQPPTGDPTLLQQLLRDREHINADAGKPRSDHSRPHFASPLVDFGWIQRMSKLELFLIIWTYLDMSYLDVWPSLSHLDVWRVWNESNWANWEYRNLSAPSFARLSMAQHLDASASNCLELPRGLLNVHRGVWRSPRRRWAKHVGISWIARMWYGCDFLLFRDTREMIEMCPFWVPYIPKCSCVQQR